MNKEEKLSPKELALQAEDTAMLNAIAGNKNLSSIVDAEGNPIVKPQGEGVNKAEAEATEKAELRQHIAEQEARKKFYDELHNELKTITEKDPTAQECFMTMLAAFKAIWWAKMELASCDEAMDAVVDYAEAYARTAAYNSEKGFHLHEVINNFKHHVIPFMQSREKHYRGKGVLRAKRVKGLHLDPKKGLTLPFKLDTIKSDRPFSLGNMMVLYGEQSVVREALQKVSLVHRAKDNGISCYLSSVDGEQKGDWANMIMPPSWWGTAGKSLNEFANVLQPSIDKGTTMLCVEKLDGVYSTGGKERPPLERKALAMKRLYQWAVENLVAVVAGDGLSAGEAAYTEVYGLIPHVHVTKSELGALLFDGKVIGE